MRSGLADAINEALALWMLGDIGPVAALEALCAVTEPCEVSCALVRGGTDAQERQGAEDRHEALAFARIALLSGGNRRLFGPREASFSSLFAGSALRAEPAWAACEPVADASGAAIVVIGWSDVHQHDVLSTLPLLARAIAVILSRQEVVMGAAKLQHAINNLLASVVANVEYAADLIEDPHVDPPLLASASHEHRAEVVQAMQNARQAVNEMAARVRQMAELARRGSM